MNSNLSIALSLVLWMTAAFFCWRGAYVGMRSHMVPRVVLAVGVSWLAGSYLLDLFVDDALLTILNIRRAAGWVTAAALAWTSLTGIAAGRRMQADADEMVSRFDDQIEVLKSIVEKERQ